MSTNAEGIERLRQVSGRLSRGPGEGRGPYSRSSAENGEFVTRVCATLYGIHASQDPNRTARGAFRSNGEGAGRQDVQCIGEGNEPVTGGGRHESTVGRPSG